MECNSCGIKKPKNDARDFTKVVVENINPEEIVMFRKVVVPASMGDDTTNPPKAGKYHNVILYYEANDHIYIYSSDGIPTLITANIDKIQAALNKEIDDREAADEVLQQEIDEIKNNPDVVDIVDTYADLQAYDTSKLGDKDIIRVLQDETHDGASTYYRWDKPHSTWNYIGEAGDYYTKDQVDTLLGAKQNTLVAGTNIQIAADGVTISATDTTYSAGTGLNLNDTTFSVDTTTIQPKLTAGSNITIDANNEISATDTTYSDFVGATSVLAGVHGLVPAPTTADVDKVLRGDGTWGDAGTTTTVFYITDIEQPAAIYKDNSYTEAATAQDILDAIAAGGAVLESGMDGSYLTLEGYIYSGANKTFFFTGSGEDSFTFDYATASATTPTFTSSALQEKLVAGTNISIAADGVTISATDTTYSTGTSSTAGITKLYDQNGQNTDGAVTQKHFTDVVGDVEAALQILNSGAGVP